MPFPSTTMRLRCRRHPIVLVRPNRRRCRGRRIPLPNRLHPATRSRSASARAASQERVESQTACPRRGEVGQKAAHTTEAGRRASRYVRPGERKSGNLLIYAGILGALARGLDCRRDRLLNSRKPPEQTKATEKSDETPAPGAVEPNKDAKTRQKPSQRRTRSPSRENWPPKASPPAGLRHAVAILALARRALGAIQTT